MRSIAIIRRLWRRRLLLTLGVWIALVIQALTIFRVDPGWPPALEARRHEVGVASAAMLVDAESSQVVDLGTTDSEVDLPSLTARAYLLADLVTSSPLREQIATRAGIPVDKLVTIAPGGASETSPPRPAGGSTVDGQDPWLSELKVIVRESAPIITARAESPTEALAARLAEAAVSELTAHLDKVAVSDAVPTVRRVVVEALGSAQVETVTRGPSRLLSGVLALVVMGLWCAGILAVEGIRRAWRQAAELESLDAGREEGPAADLLDLQPPAVAQASRPRAVAGASEAAPEASGPPFESLGPPVSRSVAVR